MPGPCGSESARTLVQPAVEPPTDRVVHEAWRVEPFGADFVQETLPFEMRETAFGPLFVRTSRFETQHYMGKVPIRVPRDSDASMLALLALDPSLAGVELSRALFLDTETTGLSGGTGTVAFLVGMGGFDDGGRFVVEQLLLQTLGEEVPLLSCVLDRVRNASAIVTFNGKAFDIPLLRTRLIMNRLPPFDGVPHLDLVHLARRLHRARIGACNLGSVESNVLGFERVGDVPSCEIAGRYFHYLRTGDASALLDVATHNVWDVVSMAALVTLYSEPLDLLVGEDLADVAAVVHRARRAEHAASIADVAVAKGGGARALRTRANLSKARGEKHAALADFERLDREVDDPSVRLELAKLYEHYVKAIDRAIETVDRGISEGDSAVLRRRERLCRKLERAAATALKTEKSQQAMLPLEGLEASSS